MTISPEKKIRCFVAINPGAAVPAELLRAQRELEAKLKGEKLKIKWGQPEAHLTLLFPGNIERGRAEAVSSALTGTAKLFSPFKGTLSNLGMFGPSRAPRVIWAGIEASEYLMNLQCALVDAVRGVGIAAEDRKFHPHFTLGRVKFCHDGKALRHALEQTELRPLSFPVNSIELIRSELLPSGPRYTVLFSAPLS